MTLNPLPRSFYELSAREVAPALLGRWLVRNTPGGLCGGPIVETEAYLAGDPACHAFGGQTARNRVMWGPPGFAYVYLIYGNHFCVNAVCCPAGTAEAVLIRAIEAVAGLDLMAEHRPGRAIHELVNGPGKLCSALAITRGLDGADVCDAASPVYIAENPELVGFLKTRGPILTSPRIGLAKAADLALRFYLGGSPFLSRNRTLKRPRGAGARGVTAGPTSG